MALSLIEHGIGTFVLICGYAGWAVMMAGLCEINYYFFSQNGESHHAAGIDTSVSPTSPPPCPCPHSCLLSACLLHCYTDTA